MVQWWPEATEHQKTYVIPLRVNSNNFRIVSIIGFKIKPNHFFLRLRFPPQLGRRVHTRGCQFACR